METSHEVFGIADSRRHMTFVCVVFTGLLTFIAANGWAEELRLFPATPQEFAQLYGAASASKSAEAVASFYSAEVRSVPFKGDPYIMSGKEEQRERLAGFFEGVSARGISGLILSDYAITQISDHFAFARLRWDLTTADGVVVNTVNSTYVIRLEEAGWRVVSILEMGRPHGP